MVAVLLLLFLLCALPLQAERIRLAEMTEADWARLQGQRVTIDEPLYVVGSKYGEIWLAPERLYVPEERAHGLAAGDSTAYFQWQAYNKQRMLYVAAPYDYRTLKLGATVRGIEARVDSAHHLSTGKTVKYKNTAAATVPKMPDARLRVCGANIQNFFYHLGGYATARMTPYDYELQRLKIATALVKLNADLYALCEVERGTSAPEALCAAMNSLTTQHRYTFINTRARDGDTISCGYIYRADRLKPHGPLRLAYQDTTNIYAYRFMLQGFEELSSGERFVVSVNHLRSKRLPDGGTPQMVHERRMANVDSILCAIRAALDEDVYQDQDILLLGDYNCYTMEAPIQTLVRAGYEDMLMRYDSTGYSYVYRGEMGYLDRVFASPSMAKQVVAAQPVHWNTDYYRKVLMRQKPPQKVEGAEERLPKYVPSKKAILKPLSPKSKKRLQYRYSDHDPILVGITLRGDD